MKEQGFKIPDNYFEQRKESLKEISQAEPLSSKPSPLRLWPWLAAAASIVVAIILFPTEHSQDKMEFSNLHSEQVLEFLSEDPYAVHPESFLELSDSSENDWQIIDLQELEHYLDNRSYEYL